MKYWRISSWSYSAQRIFIICAFSIIPLALLFTFAYLPVINMFKYSFTDWNGYSKGSTMLDLRTTHGFLAIRNTLKYSLLVCIILWLPLYRWAWPSILPRSSALKSKKFL